ncbi:hypothetical protein PMIN01_05796 [Paraphaeosphaeria minitans]|uniref:Uncharacterized protein n=1 Tax=Paraphaeosphaeria minitans TaxID=565426 RepID=A0A9P6KRI8_9PLEO|nr:hypothetical protein PMIN01_05796 [Paraphaeosphaeria minitans]
MRCGRLSHARAPYDKSQDSSSTASPCRWPAKRGQPWIVGLVLRHPKVPLEKVDALRLRAAAKSGRLSFACFTQKEFDIFDLLMLLSAPTSLGRTPNAELTSSQAFATPMVDDTALQGNHAAASTTCAE